MKLVRRVTRNQLVLCLLGVWFAAAIAVFCWFTFQNSSYRQQASEYRAGVSETIKATTQAFAALHAASDTAGISKVLTDSANAFKAKARQAPQVPGIAGLKLGTEGDGRRQQQITEQSNALGASLQKAADYLAYQQQIAAPLQELILLSSANQQQLDAMVGKWQAFGHTLAALTPPAAAQSAHTELRQKTDVVIAALAPLPALYKKTDITGFTAKQKELSAAIEGLRQVGAQFSAIATAHDRELTQAIASLKNILQ